MSTMRLKFSKLGLICLALILALGTMGIAYAKWSEQLDVIGMVKTGELDWEFTDFSIKDCYPGPGGPADYHCNDGFTGSPPFWQDPDGKNVGWTTGVLVDGPDNDDDMSQFDLTLHNVYPGYFDDVSVYARINGTIPLVIEKVNFIVGGVVKQTLTATGYVALDLDGTGIMTSSSSTGIISGCNWIPVMRL